MLKHNAIAAAIGSIALFSGCATTDQSAVLNIEPVLSVRGGVDAEGQYRIGRYYQGQLRHEAAEKAFLKALAIDPNHAEAYNALGTLYFAMGRVRMAEEHFQRAIAIAPTRAHLHNNLGYLYQEIGRTEEAVIAYSEAFRLEPKNQRVLNNLAALTCQDRSECLAAVAEKPSDNEATQVVAPQTAAAAIGVEDMSAASTEQRLAVSAISTPTAIAPTVQLASVAPNVWELRPAPRGAVSKTNAPAPELAMVQSAIQASTPVQVRAAGPQTTRTATGRVEVANGNGVRGMAKRVGGYLQVQGYAAPRLTNHRTFTQNRTEIQYVDGAEKLARQIEREFAQPARLVKVSALERQAPVRVVLGKDFNEEVVTARRASPAGDVVASATLQQSK